MGRKPPERSSSRFFGVPSPRVPWAAALPLLFWFAAASVAQGVLGPEGGRAGPKLEQMLERRGAEPQTQPERSHEDDALEPWELVRV